MAVELHEGDIPLAGYLLARQAVGRPVEGPDLDLLRDAHASVREARELLPLGRGNVREDLRATHGLSRWATLHMRELAEKETPHKRVVAMVSFQGGLCDEYAVLSGLSLAARMSEDVHARLARRQPRDGEFHVWTEAAQYGDFDDRAHTVVLDAWSSGPAVFAPDSNSGSAANVTARDSHGFKYISKRSHGEVLEKAKAEARRNSIPKPALPSWYGPSPDPSAIPCVHSLRSSVKSELAQFARAILTREITPEKAYTRLPTSRRGESPICEEGRKGIPADLRASIQAVGIARQLAPGMNVKGLATAASKIVDVATKLDNAMHLNQEPHLKRVT